jgi:riboflavin kinase / FMN adenylyltransferase
MKGAAALLGYVYTAEGESCTASTSGGTIGFPHAQPRWSPDLRPLYGVYAVRVSGAKSYGWLPAVANYGLRPTVEQSVEPRLEIHMLVPAPTGRAIRSPWSGSASSGRRGSSRDRGIARADRPGRGRGPAEFSLP